MRILPVAALSVLSAVTAPIAMDASRPQPRIVRVTDTVFIRPAPIDYDELARRVAMKLESRDRARETTVIDGDLVIKGRVSIGGDPEPGTGYGLTIHAPVSAGVRFISNEAEQDPQRTANQHRHVGTLSLAQDGGLRLDQNSTCFTDKRGCTTEDRARRRAYSGYDSLGDWSFYLSDVDSLTGQSTAPRSQSLVLGLLAWDGHIHIASFRPGQRIFFNGSTTLNASDLQWEVPLAPVPAAR